ncbi:MAG: hypothetical protein II694_12105 [Lachnospiraceae bacterium]|nr:hypothetical protein [Lachnospiraceae bacterium]
MKFCAYCGRQLQDDEVCTCRDAAEAAKKEAENVSSDVTETAATVQTEAAAAVENAQAQAGDAAQAAQTQAPIDWVPYQSNASAPSGGGKKWLIPALCAAGVVALITIVVLAVSVFGGSKSKIGKAAVKTFADAGYLAEDLGGIKASKDKASLSISGKYQKVEVGMGVSVNGSDMQMSVSLKEGKKVDLSAVIEFSKKALKAKLNGTDYKKVLVYDYNNSDKDGLEDMAGEANIKSLDEALQTMADSLGKGNSSGDKYTKAISKWFNGLKVKKEDSKSIKVDGEKRDCKGYSVEITEEDVEELIDELFELAEKDLADVVEQAGYDDIDDLKDQVMKSVEKMEDIELTFYLYKDMFAGINIESDGESAYIEFNGGDYRLQNFTVYQGKKSDNNVLLTASGKIKDNKETMTIEVPEQYSMNYSYDKKSGKLEVALQQYSYWYGGFSDLFTMKGTLECSRSSATLSVKEVSAAGTTIPVDKLEITVSTKDDMQSMKGTEFSIDKADEADLKEEFNDIYEALYDAMMESDTLKELIGSFGNLF